MHILKFSVLLKFKIINIPRKNIINNDKNNNNNSNNNNRFFRTLECDIIINMFLVDIAKVLQSIRI